MGSVAFTIYLVFIVSWFARLPSRAPFLGTVRFDLVLVGVLTLLLFLQRGTAGYRTSRTGKILGIFIAYCILSVPFVEWPGSAVHTGLPKLIKAGVFYFFSLAFIKGERELKIFLLVFLGCQIWRIAEPLYLHVTEGYWGSVASMADWESLNRLSGAPHDIVNPNGLAFIVCTVLPFLFFFSSLNRMTALGFLLITPACLYTLFLTGSRSGFLGLTIVLLGIVVKSKRRVTLLSAGLLIGMIGFSALDEDRRDRYLSIFGAGEKNASSLEGRYEGVIEDFRVSLRRPLFGHGLGTSLEANANYRGIAQPSHNLYTEILQEVGFTGLIIFAFFIKSIIENFAQARRMCRMYRDQLFLNKVVDAMEVWLAMNIVFSFASYGLTSYEWYLFAALSVIIIEKVKYIGHEEKENTSDC